LKTTVAIAPLLGIPAWGEVAPTDTSLSTTVISAMERLVVKTKYTKAKLTERTFAKSAITQRKRRKNND
jgi:hypothetical protein